MILYFVGAVRTAGRAYAHGAAAAGRADAYGAAAAGRADAYGAGPASCGAQSAARRRDAAAQRGPHHTAASRSKTQSYSCLILVPASTSTAYLMICYRAATSTALDVRMKHVGVISRCCPRKKILEQ